MKRKLITALFSIVAAASIVGFAWTWDTPATASQAPKLVGIVVDQGIYPVCGKADCAMVPALRVQPADPELATVFVKASPKVLASCPAGAAYPSCAKR